MSYCDKSNCGYYYKGEDDDFPCCHYPENDPFPAPCEYDDETETEDHDEDDVQCTWCEEWFCDTEVVKEINLGCLCHRCAAAIQSRGEKLIIEV